MEFNIAVSFNTLLHDEILKNMIFFCIRYRTLLIFSDKNLFQLLLEEGGGGESARHSLGLLNHHLLTLDIIQFLNYGNNSHYRVMKKVMNELFSALFRDE